MIENMSLPTPRGTRLPGPEACRLRPRRLGRFRDRALRRAVPRGVEIALADKFAPGVPGAIRMEDEQTEGQKRHDDEPHEARLARRERGHACRDDGGRRGGEGGELHRVVREAIAPKHLQWPRADAADHKAACHEQLAVGSYRQGDKDAAGQKREGRYSEEQPAHEGDRVSSRAATRATTAAHSAPLAR